MVLELCSRLHGSTGPTLADKPLGPADKLDCGGDEALLPRASVLASLAAQKKNIEGEDLKRPKGGVVLVVPMHVLAHGGPVKRTSKIEDAGGTGVMFIGRARATSRRRDWRLLDRGVTGAGSGGEEAKVTRDFCPLSERPLLEGESAGQRRLELPARNEWAASVLGLNIGAAAEEEEDGARSRPERTRGASKLIATTASGRPAALLAVVCYCQHYQLR